MIGTLKEEKSYSLAFERMNLADREDLFERTLEVCRHYWARTEYDNRSTHSNIKTDARSIIPTINKLLKLLRDVPSPTRAAIEYQLTQRAERLPSEMNRVAAAEATITELRKACTRLTNRTSKRQAKTAVIAACRALWIEWETVTGQPFKRRPWEIRKGHDKGGKTTKDFAEDDASFVLAVLQAIDPGVTIKNVRSGLTEVRKSKGVKNRTK